MLSSSSSTVGCSSSFWLHSPPYLRGVRILACDFPFHGSLNAGEQLIPEFLGFSLQSRHADLLIAFFERFGTLIDVGLPPAQCTVDQGGQLSGGCEHRDVCSNASCDPAIVGTQRGCAVTQ